MRVAAEIALSKEERGHRRVARRCAYANKVGRWRARVAKEGTSSIEKERPRGANHGGKNTKKRAQLRSEVVEATTQTTPNDATHWPCRSMARHLNTTHSFVNRVWRAPAL